MDVSTQIVAGGNRKVLMSVSPVPFDKLSHACKCAFVLPSRFKRLRCLRAAVVTCAIAGSLLNDGCRCKPSAGRLCHNTKQ